METPSPRLPVEVLELVVDNIREDDVDEVDYDSIFDEYCTLSACCLVSSDLLSRSRRNLLHRVCIITMDQLERFVWMLDAVVANRQFVVELIVLSTDDPSPVKSFPPMLAGKLPNLRNLRLRTEVGPLPDPAMRPALELHRGAFASLSSFQDLAELHLFGLRFLQFKHFLRLISSVPKVSVLQCMQLWFNPPGTRSAPALFIPDQAPVRPLRLSHVDLAFIPRVVMKGLLHAFDPGCIKHLVITPNKVPLNGAAEAVYGDVAYFHKLVSFTFYVAVTADGAEYTEVLDIIALLDRNVRTITLSHYLHGDARNHNVPKRSMIDALRRNADVLERSLDQEHFSAGTRVVFQFEGFHGSEDWWTKELEPVLPNLFKVQHDPGGRYLSVENITYSDWSPWEDDRAESAPN